MLHSSDFAAPRRGRLYRARALQRLAFAAAAVAAAEEACAGAWTLPEGAGQVIVSGSFMAGSKLFDGKGHLVPVPEYSKFELTPFAEYGVTDWLTAIASPSLLTVTAKGDPTDRYSGLGYTEFGARARLAQAGSAVFSAQTTARLPGALNPDNRAETGNTVPELDLRALGGVSFSLGDWPGFFDAEAAYRLRGGTLPNEYRVDLTLGVRPFPGLLLMAQSFNVVGDGEWPGVYRHARYHKLQGSIVYDVTETWSVQLGLVGTVAGRNALQERGGLLAAWARF